MALLEPEERVSVPGRPRAKRHQLTAQWLLVADRGTELVVRAHQGSPHVDPQMTWRALPNQPGTPKKDHLFELVP